jgi:feruloyl esterase
VGLCIAGCAHDNGAPKPVSSAALSVTLAKSCDTASFADLRLPDATVTSAALIPSGAYTPSAGSPSLPALPVFCRISGKATPTSDSLIGFELWVPVDHWNGKLVATGNGGYSPALNYGDMAYAMREGYAVLGGDSGHQSSDPNDMLFAVGHPQKIIDRGTHSVHAITVWSAAHQGRRIHPATGA